MNKKILNEIKRIHEITYNKLQCEQIVSKAEGSINKKRDISSKADLINPDVNDFFRTIETSIKNGGLSQQKRGSMTYKKEVEALQIALIIVYQDLELTVFLDKKPLRQ